MDFEQDLRDLADAARGYYLERFAKVIESLKADSCTFQLEVCANTMVTPNKKTLSDLPERVDVLITQPPKRACASVVRTKGLLSFDTVEAMVDDKPVVVAPFRWEDCGIILAGDLRKFDFCSVCEWLGRWNDPDPKAPPQGPFLEVAHGFHDFAPFDQGVKPKSTSEQHRPTRLSSFWAF